MHPFKPNPAQTALAASTAALSPPQDHPAPRFFVQGPNGISIEVGSFDEQLRALTVLSHTMSQAALLSPFATPPAPSMTHDLYASHEAARRTLDGDGIGTGIQTIDEDGYLEGAAPAARRIKQSPFGPARYAKPQRIADSSHRAVTELMDEYMAQLPSSCMLNEKGQYECATALKLYLEVTGDKPLLGVTRLDAQAFVRTMEKWPKDATKKPAYKGLTVAQVLETADKIGAKRLSPVTVNNKVAFVRGFFEYVRLTNGLRFNPFDSVALPAPVAQFVRLPFTAPELASIFHPAHLKRLLAPQGYWLPVLAHFTGGRLREISQLYVDDIEIILGMPVVHFSDRFPGQQLKNESSRRVVPLHDELIDLGFLDYVATVRAKGYQRLFPGMGWFHGDAGFLMGKRLNETYYPKVCGLGPGKTFHCHRHHFIDQAAKSGLVDADIARLTGHKLQAQSVIRRNYVQSSTLAVRKAHLMSIPLAPIFIPPYNPAQFEPHFVQLERNLRLVENKKAPRPLKVITMPPRKKLPPALSDEGSEDDGE
ncbi:site-specific integrase [Luteibacter pinisoli]|uniref:Site-specific integrase n=1 Tax=Luteibacter pinisoli TaxID=2589080 RepID=A0A4Y5Z3D3_9GAMM|nr:site-specific integrase [Luteibacter pinisoli]QDE39872.1 site-specific integrase [Luteibacter pinisoli]